MYFYAGGEGCVIDGSDTVREPRSMFGDRRGGVRNGSNPGVMYAVGASGRKGGRS